MTVEEQAKAIVDEMSRYGYVTWVQPTVDRIAAALRAAEERGRQAGLAQAADLVEAWAAMGREGIDLKCALELAGRESK